MARPAPAAERGSSCKARPKAASASWARRAASRASPRATWAMAEDGAARAARSAVSRAAGSPRRAGAQREGRPLGQDARPYGRRGGGSQLARGAERFAGLHQLAQPGQHARQRERQFRVAGGLRRRLLQDLDRLVLLPLGELGFGLGQGFVEALVGRGG